MIGYVRVSTSEQAESGVGLDAQRAAIQAEADRRGWQLVAIEEDAGASGKSTNGRPGLAAALAALDRHDADALIVAKLDRLSRSLIDAAGILERARKRGWAVVALDLGVDTTTPAGELVANVMASVAQWERRAIGQRTKDALAMKRAQGVQLGRPRTMAPGIRERIRQERAAGRTLTRIADGLNADGVPTAQGGARWHASTVRYALLAA